MSLWSKTSTYLRKISKAKAFSQGQRISMTNYSQLPFDNDYAKLRNMFMLRLYQLNNTPYEFYALRFSNQLANLHKQINFANARILAKRTLLIAVLIGVYNYIIKEEQALDWGDRFDLKFMLKAYGQLQEASGEGNTSIDD